jgi:formylglycine-generating enzyme required for sulfatase activity
MPAQVFISYSRKDTAFVEKLERALNQRGILTWRDLHSIGGGDEWFRAIKAGLCNSYAMVYVDTPNAEGSAWVMQEYLYARRLSLPILPVTIDPTHFSLQTISLQPILCTDERFEIAVAQLAAAFAALPQSAVTAPPLVENPSPLRPQDERDYLEWVLVNAKADLLDARYVRLIATPSQPTAQNRDEGSFWDEDVFRFERLGLEQVRGEAFDKPGEDVEDARDALRQLERALLLGDPGAGKTTTLLQILVDLARAALQKHGERLPVFVPLRKFDGTKSFAEFVRSGMYTLQGSYEQLLREGRLILLCDALNEMPRRAADGRDLVAEVRAYLSDKLHWVVSCRVRDYQETLKDIPGVGKVQLKPLDPPRIQQFIAGWFHQAPDVGAQLWAAMGGSEQLLNFWRAVEARGEAERFWKPGRPPSYTKASDVSAWYAMHADRRRILPLCRRPLMASMVCQLYEGSKERKLPANRGVLFAAFTDNLLQRERERSQRTGALWLDQAVIKEGLAQIAYALGSETEMARANAEGILQQHLPHVDATLLLRLAVAANLLDPGDEIRFSHQMIQEYFASEILQRSVAADTDPAALWQPAHWWEANGREETLIILAGVRGDPEGVARWVAPGQPELAVQVLTDCGILVDLRALEAETRAVLVAAARAKTDERDPRGRAAAYRALGLLGADARRGVGVVKKPSPPSPVSHSFAALTGERGSAEGAAGEVMVPDIVWAEVIGARWYVMGGDDAAYQSFLPTEIRIAQPYRVGKYLVTQGQYLAFQNDSSERGYTCPDWWAGLAASDDDKRPAEPRFRYDNHPMENVNWYQAVAFCRWLTLRLRGMVVMADGTMGAAGVGAQYIAPLRTDDTSSDEVWIIGENAVIRLPHEYEWEVAARGTDGREYPYEGKFDASKGNTLETGIGMTSAVGLFPDGESPYHILDMSGNVWQWCLNKYGNPEQTAVDDSRDARVVRGGSFVSNQYFAAASYRNDPIPYFWSYNYGFRVVCASL